MKNVMLLTGAGQIGMAIARRGAGATASYYDGPLKPKEA